MKLVDQFIDPDRATAARARLRAAGIAALLDTLDPHHIQPSKSGKTRIGLWIIDDEQHTDAIQVLIDPGHQPQRVYHPEEIARLEVSADKKSRVWHRPGGIAFALLFAAGLLALIAYGALQFFRGL